GIRDWSVTGVQTCALPILPRPAASADLVKSIGILRERAMQSAPRRTATRAAAADPGPGPIAAPSRTGLLVPVLAALIAVVLAAGIGRASCRGGGWVSRVAG